MANMGIGYFNSKGQFFRTPEEATISDLAAILGKVGEGESLAPGIAKLILDKRGAIEKILSEFDEMVSVHAERVTDKADIDDIDDDNVTPFRTTK